MWINAEDQADNDGKCKPINTNRIRIKKSVTFSKDGGSISSSSPIPYNDVIFNHEGTDYFKRDLKSAEHGKFANHKVFEYGTKTRCQQHLKDKYLLFDLTFYNTLFPQEGVVGLEAGSLKNQKKRDYQKGSKMPWFIPLKKTPMEL